VNADSLKDVLPTEEVTLKRHLGLFSGVCFIVGVIIGKNKYIIFFNIINILLIGSGIFVSPKGVLRETQSIGLCLVIWVACGVVSLVGSFLCLLSLLTHILYRSTMLCRDWCTNTKKWSRDNLYERRYWFSS